MVTIRTCKVFSHALGEYLRQADYYSEGMKVEGRSYGRLCARVGLVEGATITDEAFERVASNHHAATGEQLTERMAASRRAGYDAVFNAPKSVSIQAFLGDDERLIVAHDTAVAEALRELETFACHQHGRGINKRHVRSGQIAAAVFCHGESRALDPHLHSHAFIFNVTQHSSDPGQLLALETSNVFERARYLTEVYRNVFAREVLKLGYVIERREHGFELAGVPRELLDQFSKRAKERDAAIAAREAEIHRQLTRDEIAVLVRENRAKKQYELTPEEVRQHQVAQTNEREIRQLKALKGGAATTSAGPLSLPGAIDRASEHLFERRTVVPLHEFTAEVIRQSYGQHPLSEIKAAIRSGLGGLLIADDQVSTRPALELERELVERLNAGVGACPVELGVLSPAVGLRLSPEQQTALDTILGSWDRALVLRGKAGTGKTHTLAAAIESMAAVRREVACFAPSTQAVELLKKDGADQVHAGRAAAGGALAAAETVQRLLVDSALQQSITNKVVIVDEYGLLSVRQLRQLVGIAEERHARLLLVGDSAQHKSVEAGDAARIVEAETRVTVAELREVRRQSVNPVYRVAAEALAAGRISDGLRQLDAMDAIVEVENPTFRRAQMVDEWFAASEETKAVRTRDGTQVRAKTALMIAPTWAEIDALNAHARQKLREVRRLSGEDRTFLSLRAKDWTKGQQKDVRNYQRGDILVVHKTTKHFEKYDEMRVVRQEIDRLVVACAGREISVSPRQSALAWTVCEERPLAIANGDCVRLRAVARACTADGRSRRLANGTTVTIQSVDPAGRLVLADGSTLLSRQLVHGYAMTSHAAQGLTVDRVFVAGATSREGLYVSATRGREMVRVFVPDREAFLDAAALKAEARLSALELARGRSTTRLAVSDYLVRAWCYLLRVRSCVATLLPSRLPARSGANDESPRRHVRVPRASSRIRVGL